MQMISFEQALNLVAEKLATANLSPPTEAVPLTEARGRVLARDVLADRDYPPFPRSTRDGYAVRAADVRQVPTWLACVGEARAGAPYPGKLVEEAGVCIEIMTGAPVPPGADAVVMIERTRRDGSRVEILRAVELGENVVAQGSEAPSGGVVLPRERRVMPGEMALLASVGVAVVDVFLQPSVAILPTGDEVVPIDHNPKWFEIRNSNAIALGGQVAAAGGIPHQLGIAPDEVGRLRELIEAGLERDLLILSGGVSAGKYDLVERVLAELGGEFYFQSVALRPGKPTVFGRVRGKFFFGLPGNPVSTFATFEVFARPAIAVLGGAAFERPLLLRARLGKAFRQSHGLTAFTPARVEMRDGDPVVTPVSWQGSGDLVGLAAANCLLVVHPYQTELAAGEWVDVFPKAGLI
jgi:molybdopterin molybdotransferase